MAFAVAFAVAFANSEATVLPPHLPVAVAAASTAVARVLSSLQLETKPANSVWKEKHRKTTETYHRKNLKLQKAGLTTQKPWLEPLAGRKREAFGSNCRPGGRSYGLGAEFGVVFIPCVTICICRVF